MYLFIKNILFLHIFSAILSIGPYFVLFPMLNRMKRIDGEKLNDMLVLFRVIVRSTMHAGHVLLITGIILVWKGNWSWFSSWLVVPLIILLLGGYFISRAFSPNIRRYHAAKITKDQLIHKLTRANILYLAILLISMWFMVIKPALWD